MTATPNPFSIALEQSFSAHPVDLSGTLEDDPRAGYFHELMTTSLLRADSDMAWMRWPSIERALKFIANYCPDKERKYGRVKEATHYIEVADRCLRFADDVAVPAEVLAFVALLHDVYEDNPELTPERLVTSCWYYNGRLPTLYNVKASASKAWQHYAKHLFKRQKFDSDKDWRPLIVQLIYALTDPLKLRPSKEQKAKLSEEELLEIRNLRFRSQIQSANDDQTKTVGLIRLQDKHASARRDNLTLCCGTIPFGSIDDYYAYLQPRYETVMAIHMVPTEAKREYLDFFVNNLLSNLDTLDVVLKNDVKRPVHINKASHLIGNDGLLAVKKCGRAVGLRCPQAQTDYAGASCLEHCSLHGPKRRNKKKGLVSRFFAKFSHNVASALAL